MSSNSRGRDVYEAKMRGKDPAEIMRLLLASPYRKHQLRGRRVLGMAQAIDQMKKDNPERVEEMQRQLDSEEVAHV